MDRVTRLANQNAVVIFSSSTCHMCHAVKKFFRDLGVHAAVYELNEDPSGWEMERELTRLLVPSSSVPAVFIGGRLVGATEKVMSLHLKGSLVPMLKAAGALWL